MMFFFLKEKKTKIKQRQNLQNICSTQTLTIFVAQNNIIWTLFRIIQNRQVVVDFGASQGFFLANDHQYWQAGIDLEKKSYLFINYDFHNLRI